MITEATIRRTRLFPECLPEARVLTVLQGAEASPAPLLLRQFDGRFARIGAVAAEQNANALLRARNDAEVLEINCDGYPTNTAGDPYLTKWGLTGTEILQLYLYAAANLTNFRLFYNLWVWRPTVADKLKHGKLLSSDEAALAERLGLANSVEKGVLPLPIGYQVEREYQVLDEITYTARMDVGTTEATLAYHPARPNEVLVLTALAAARGTVAQNVLLRIDRDDDADYLEFPVYPLRREIDWPCFIPALSSLRLKVISSLAAANHPFRYTVRRCLLTNTLRVRFGLVSKDEVPGDLWDKVQGGVL